MRQDDNNMLFTLWPKKTLNSREGQRTNLKYRNLVGSDQQMRRLEETELRKADLTVVVNCYIFSKVLTVNPNRTFSLSKFRQLINRHSLHSSYM